MQNTPLSHAIAQNPGIYYMQKGIPGVKNTTTKKHVFNAK